MAGLMSVISRFAGGASRRGSTGGLGGTSATGGRSSGSGIASLLTRFLRRR